MEDVGWTRLVRRKKQRVAGGADGGEGEDLEAMGDGDGWVAEGRGGWLSAGSKGGARSSFRGTVALGG